MTAIVGDIHGNFSFLTSLLENDDIKNIIQLGDFGIGFYTNDIEKLLEMNERASSLKKNIYVIRGNHDNPSYFKGNHYYSNLKLLKDYEYLNIEGYNILFIGGAISVDRRIRSFEKDWWFNEKFYLDINKIENLTPDIVITHTAPNNAPPETWSDIVYEWNKRDVSLYQELKDERYAVLKIYNELDKSKLMYWFYGHFHKSIKIKIDNIDFVCLDVKEVFKIN